MTNLELQIFHIWLEMDYSYVICTPSRLHVIFLKRKYCRTLLNLHSLIFVCIYAKSNKLRLQFNSCLHLVFFCGFMIFNLSYSEFHYYKQL